MPTHVALLRGINVGRGNRIAMADLRAVVEGLGHADVATYIASGNVVFTATGTPAALAAAMADAIAEQTPVRPEVVVRTRDELADVVFDNPYPDVADPKKLHAGFAQAAVPGTGVAAALERASARGSEDTATVVGGTLYLHTPGGLGRSILAEELGRGTGLAPVTMRNWATVTRLLTMLRA